MDTIRIFSIRWFLFIFFIKWQRWCKVLCLINCNHEKNISIFLVKINFLIKTRQKIFLDFISSYSMVFTLDSLDRNVLNIFYSTKHLYIIVTYYSINIFIHTFYFFMFARIEYIFGFNATNSSIAMPTVSTTNAFEPS